MKKIIQYIDVLGNTIQLKTSIDVFRQIENKPYWIVESRKILPQITNWDVFYPLKNQYFETDEEAQKAIKSYALSYIEKSNKLGKKIQFEETVI